MTDCERLLSYLDDGAWHTTRSLLSRDFSAGGPGLTVHSRIADLRRKGHVIACERVPGARRGQAYRYRLEVPDDGAGTPTPSPALSSGTSGSSEAVQPRELARARAPRDAAEVLALLSREGFADAESVRRGALRQRSDTALPKQGVRSLGLQRRDGWLVCPACDCFIACGSHTRCRYDYESLEATLYQRARKAKR